MSKFIVALASVGFLAACSGSHGQVTPAVPPAASGMQTGMPMEQSGVGPDFCRHIGIIRINPCQISFTSSNPGPVRVTVSVQGHINGTVVVHSDCGGASGVARIKRKSNFEWEVTAGATTGSCQARFIFFHNGSKDGWAELKISNS